LADVVELLLADLRRLRLVEPREVARQHVPAVLAQGLSVLEDYTVELLSVPQ
jgi:hypothetical protein